MKTTAVCNLKVDTCMKPMLKPSNKLKELKDCQLRCLTVQNWHAFGKSGFLAFSFKQRKRVRTRGRVSGVLKDKNTRKCII